jgi:hypothetical protein
VPTLSATPLSLGGGSPTSTLSSPGSISLASPNPDPPASPPSDAPPPEPETEFESQLNDESGGGVTSDPIDPKFLTVAPFGTSSFWIQPWRAYMDTWPASRLLNSVGINFDVQTPQAEGAAQLLQDSGFKLARIGINWDSLSYEDPTRFANESSIRTRLTALRNHGLRPLILLDANSQDPAPSKPIVLDTVAEAPAGSRTVQLTPSSAIQIVAGKSGFDQLSFGGDPDILVTSIQAGDVAVLSEPLPTALPAGEHKGATLRYAPFGAPTLANGQPNPAFQETLEGWLSYVASVCKEAASIFGPEGYDLEVWNELSFGSQFLNSENYFSAEGASETEAEEGLETKESELEETELQENSPVPSKAHVTREVAKALLNETVAYVRNPANGIPAGVGISDGFASQTPFPSGSQAPAGLTALSKHLYNSPKSFPGAERERAIRPLNALGARDTASKHSFAPLFVPSYQSAFPEYYLTATSTESIVRDLAPFTTYVYGFPHGREVGPPGGAPVQKWMTEYNLNPGKGVVVGPDEHTPQTGSQAGLTPADKAHFQTKAILRSLVSMVGKGMTREYFYHAAPGPLSLIGEEFNTMLATNPNTYPGDQTGGETMTAMKNMLSQFQGPGPQGPARQLTLLSIAQNGNHAQFTGDGTTAHPNLYDREVLAVLPFQSSPTRFVIPVYVMTRDLLTLYQPNTPTTNTNRFDLPNETFRITLGNLPPTTTPPTITAYDPIHNTNTPAHLITNTNNTLEIELTATDYPRILTIDYTGA